MRFYGKRIVNDPPSTLGPHDSRGLAAVADDELSAPLGQSAKKKRRRFKLPIARSAHRRGRARGVPVGLRGLGAGGRRPARRRADGGGRDRFRSAKRPGHAGRGIGRRRGARPAQLRRPGQPAPKQAQVPAPAQPAAAPPRTPRPSPSSTARPASARRSRSRRARDVRAPLEQRLLETSRHGAHPAHRAGRRPSSRSLRPRR